MKTNQRKWAFTSTFVRRHVNCLPPDVLFSTRELLQYGKRSAVDQSLSRLVKRGDIIRLTRGLFRREGYNNIPLPAPAEVAKYKANAFNKRIMITHIPIINAKPSKNAFSSQANLETAFATNGRSSLFRYGSTIIKLKGISQKKFDERRVDSFNNLIH